MYTTRKEIDDTFAELVKLIGAEVGNSKGNYRIDHSPNGYKIARVSANGSGISYPFGNSRHAAGAFLAMMYFAIQMIHAANANKS